MTTPMPLAQHPHTPPAGLNADAKGAGAPGCEIFLRRMSFSLIWSTGPFVGQDGQLSIFDADRNGSPFTSKCRCGSQKMLSPTGDRWFESVSLQQRVHVANSPALVVAGRRHAEHVGPQGVAYIAGRECIGDILPRVARRRLFISSLLGRRERYSRLTRCWRRLPDQSQEVAPAFPLPRSSP
jgi:hypothetical protein